MLRNTLILSFLLAVSSALYAQDAAQERCRVWTAMPIPQAVFQRMKGRSFPDDCTVGREDLRYVRVKYVDANDKEQIGEIVCNKLIANDLIEIFQELFKSRYKIGSIRLIDDFYGEERYPTNSPEGAKRRTAVDNASMAANNTSCFHYRFVTGTKRVSKHGRGMAIDINPVYNPFYRMKDGHVEPVQSSQYIKNRDTRTDIPMKIDRNDLCYKLFVLHGFKWGGAWKSVKDYQHFEK